MPYDLGLLQEAIKQQESGGDYNVVNSDSGARGAYQFMPETWADATNRAGLDPNDWSPQNQDAAARFLMGEYMNQFNDPELAARAWYGGPGNVQGSIDSDEGNYPTIRQYGQQVVQKMQQLAGGATPFTFNAKDADGNSFLKMNAYLRTSNPNEAFDQQSIMSIFGNQQTSPQYTVSDAYLAGPHYDMDLLKFSKKRASLLEPFVNKLMQNRAVDEQSFLASQAQQKKLQQAIGLSQLIGQSDNVDNRNAYAAIGHLFGVDVPTGTDQFVSNKDLLGTQIEMNNAERTYNLNKQKMAQEQANFERSQSLKERELAMKEAAVRSGGGYGSGGMTSSQQIALDKWYIEQAAKYAEEHPGEFNPLEVPAQNAQQRLFRLSGDVLNPNDYHSVMSDWTGMLESNRDHIVAGDGQAINRAAIEAMAKARYGDFAPDILENTDWGYYGL